MKKDVPYRIISDFIRTEISEGRMLPMQKVYSESELVKMFSVSRATAAKSLDLLTNENIIFRIQGKGSFVASNTVVNKKKKSTMIFDMKNHAMLILSEDGSERSGIALSIPPDTTATAEVETQQEEKYPDDFIHPWYSPTGRAKSIAGFNCKEYTYKSDEGSVDLWITKDSKLNLSQAYGHMQGFQALASGGWAYGMGMVMEMVFNDKLSGASTHMQVKDIQPNSPKRLDLIGYQIVGVGGESK